MCRTHTLLHSHSLQSIDVANIIVFFEKTLFSSIIFVLFDKKTYICSRKIIILSQNKLIEAKMKRMTMVANSCRAVHFCALSLWRL